MKGASKLACPSSTCHPGAKLFGVVLPEGQIAFTRECLEVDQEFARIAHEGRPPEQRFRFGSACMEAACRQWNGRECGLIDRLMTEYAIQFGPPIPSNPLPECPLRQECRWFRQRGALACTVCSVLVTDLGRQEAELPPEVIARRAFYARRGSTEAA